MSVLLSINIWAAINDSSIHKYYVHDDSYEHYTFIGNAAYHHSHGCEPEAPHRILDDGATLIYLSEPLNPVWICSRAAYAQSVMEKNMPAHEENAIVLWTPNGNLWWEKSTDHCESWEIIENTEPFYVDSNPEVGTACYRTMDPNGEYSSIVTVTYYNATDEPSDNFDQDLSHYEWNVVNIRSNKFLESSPEDDLIYARTHQPEQISDNYLWAFIEDEDGFYTILNKAWGPSYAMTTDSTLDEGGYIKMGSRTDAQKFIRISARQQGYYFKPIGSSYTDTYINDHFCNGIIRYNMSTDNGSILRIQSADFYRSILRQPTIDNMSVDVSNPEVARYQWFYRSNENTTLFNDWTSTNAGMNSSVSETSYIIEGQTGQEFEFEWTVSSEEQYDYLSVVINGEERIVASGIDSGRFTYIFTEDSSLEIEIKYSKDGSVNSGMDRAEIKNMKLSSPASMIMEATNNTLNEDYYKETGDYYCRITYDDSDVILISNTISIENDTNTVVIPPVKFYVGNKGDLSIEIRNSSEIVGFQFDIYLPDAIKFQLNDLEEPIVSLNSNRTTEDITDYFRVAFMNDGALRVLGSSTSNKAIIGNEGEIVRIGISIPDNTVPGNYQVRLQNITLSNKDDLLGSHIDEIWGNVIVESYLLGDANMDGLIDIADFTCIATHILGLELPLFNSELADTNHDGDINVCDLSGVVTIIMNNNFIDNTGDESADNLSNTLFLNIPKQTDDDIIPVYICMDNTYQIGGIQFDIKLPDGIEFASDKIEKFIQLTDERTGTDDIDFIKYSSLSNSEARILCSSTKGKTFEGTTGSVAILYLKKDSSLVPGEYPIELRNIVMTDQYGIHSTRIESHTDIMKVSQPSVLKTINAPKIDGEVYSINGLLITNTSNLSPGLYIINEQGKRKVIQIK